MELERFPDAAAFLERAGGFLAAHEAQNNLPLGTCSSLLREPGRYEGAPYLASVALDGEVVAAAVRTPPHNLVLSRTDAPDALPLIAADTLGRYGTLPGVLGPRGVARPFAALWREVSGQPYRLGSEQRIYELHAVRPVPGVPGELRRATRGDRELLVEWFGRFGEEALGEEPRAREWAEHSVDVRLDSEVSGIYLWHDGRPVSLAGYGGPTPNGIRIGPVYTPPPYRRRGYASACVAALSQVLLDEGYRSCFLFTDLANPTSNRIYQQVGYRPVCDVDQYEFLAPERQP